MQTKAIGIRGLLEGKVKDDNGRILPPNNLSGQLAWFSPVNGKGRILESNRRLAMARSFSCGLHYIVCGITDNQIGGTIGIGATGASLGYVLPSICQANGNSCFGGTFAYPGDDGFDYYWTSGNTSYISIASSQILGNNDYVYVNGVGVGSTSVKVAISDYFGCNTNGQGTGNVQPVINSISPAQGLIGVTTSSVTISGSGLAGATVNGGTGITPTVKSTSSTTVVVDLAVASNAAAGNHAITVTVNSQTSTSVNFYVQVPTFFTPTNSGTVLNAFCAANQAFYAFVDYQVADQAQNAIAVGGLTPLESVSQNGGSFSAFNSFATPVSTNANGTFEDVPLGTCFSVAPPPNRCIPVAQKFQLMVPGISAPFSITTTTADTECEEGIKIIVNPAGTTYTFGTLN